MTEDSRRWRTNMAFASTRSSADSRFILGGLLLTLALAVLGVNQPARLLSLPFRRTTRPTYRRWVRPLPKSTLPSFGSILRTPKRSTIEVDLLAFQFGPAASRLPGAAAVTGISAEPAMLAKFFAAAARQGLSFESAVDQVPEPKVFGFDDLGHCES